MADRNIDCRECDWEKSRMFVLQKLDGISESVDDLTRGFAEFKSEVRVALATRNGVTKSDVDNLVAAAVRRRRASDQLTREDLEEITTDLHKTVEAHAAAEPKTGWEPWKYILLGAALSIPGVLAEMVKALK